MLTNYTLVLLEIFTLMWYVCLVYSYLQFNRAMPFLFLEHMVMFCLDLKKENGVLDLEYNC